MLALKFVVMTGAMIVYLIERKNVRDFIKYKLDKDKISDLTKDADIISHVVFVYACLTFISFTYNIPLFAIAIIVTTIVDLNKIKNWQDEVSKK